MTNWSQYVAAFGEFTDGYYLAHSVYGFFNNGGTAAYVVRVGGAADGAPPRRSGRRDRMRRPGRAARRRAGGSSAPSRSRRSPPVRAGGALTVEVPDAEGEGPAERFKLVVKDGDKVVESFDVSAKKGARNYVVTQVKERSKLITVEEAAPAAQLASRTTRP